MANQREELYYKEELRYLKEAGAQFASRHADIGQYLGLTADDPALRDPHTERIIEAFAFLSGRLRRFLDGQYSQLTHGLFNLIYPHYLRPIAPKCIVALSPMMSMLDKPVQIPARTLLTSREDHEDGGYRFSTTHAIKVQPIEIDKVYVDPDTGRDFSLSVRLKAHDGFDLSACDLDALEFYIHGDPRNRYELFQHLADPTTSVVVKNMRGHAPLSIRWTGFDASYLLTPEDAGDFAMTHAIRDYFDFPERFGFFKIDGLQAAFEASNQPEVNLAAQAFQLNFLFNKAFTQGSVFGNDNLRLYCVPAVNLHPVDCEPFTVDKDRFEFPLVPQLRKPWQQIHHITKVVANHDEAGMCLVGPYFRMAGRDDHRFYTLRREQVGDGWRTYLRFLDIADDSPTPLDGWQISTQAWCCDGDRAQSLGVDSIREILPGQLPETIRCRNITQTTLAYWPPLNDPREWQFLASLAHRFRDIATRDRLRSLCDLYNHPRTDWCNRKIDGIIAVKQAKAHRIYQGFPIAGRNFEVTVDANQFQHMGDVALFTKVLGFFLQGYCPMNEFIFLRVDARNTEEVFTHEVVG